MEKMTQEYLEITGGKPLVGKIKASGAKNAMTKLLVASMLSDKKCIFYNVPNISDVEITIALCMEVGMEVNWDREKQIIEAHTKEIKNTHISQKFSGANRIPILLIGALLGRTKDEIVVPTVGGDDLGKRPLDFHLQSFKKLNADVEFKREDGKVFYCAKLRDELEGTIVEFDYPSVGATENTILAAVRAKGITVIKNAAIEPEIIDLVLFLQKLGANIAVDVDRTIRIHQAKDFNEVRHWVLTDRNEVASYAMAAIATKGRVLIEGAEHQNMITLLNKIRRIGGGFNVLKNGIEFFYKGSLKGGIQIETDVHPGFMTDWQQPLAVLLTQANGLSIIHETVYENRFGYVKTLKEMGADVELFSQCLGGKKCRFASLNHHHSIVIKGPCKLESKEISIPDLRAGFAYVMAALIANGDSKITGVSYLDRGYESLVTKLTSLGASVRRKTIKTDVILDLKKRGEKISEKKTCM
jgi:UDP-N-acetylglucosamine 1-carboxyvinyltransferase